MTSGDRVLVAAARGNPVWLGTLAVAAVAGSAAALLLPQAMAQAVDDALHGRSAGPAMLAFVALATGEVLADAVDVLATARATGAITADLRRMVANHVVRSGPRGDLATGDLVSRVTADCSAAGSVAAIAVRLAVAVVTSAGAVVALALLDWRLALVFAASTPLALLMARKHLHNTADDVIGYQRVAGELSARLLDAARGLRTITACGLAEREACRVLQPLPRLHSAGVGMWCTQSRLVWRAALLLPAVELVVLVAAGFGVVDRRLTIGQALAALGYVVLGMSLVRNIPLLTALARARASAGRLAEVLGTPLPPHGRDPLPLGPGEVELRGVTALPLCDVDLVLPAGALVAVVGRSGSGKSTLASVAGGLRVPEHGTVLLDGVPISGLAVGELRSAVGFAFDRPVLLGSTVAESIAYGTSADREKVLESVRVAQAEDTVARLPQGYETPPTGVPLSTADAQRLGVARAVVRDPRLLVLDEATASLDPASESTVEALIASALPNRTRLVVTRRADAAARADLVVWLEAGRIRAKGPHRKLWRDPDYRAVFTEAST